MSPSRTRRGPGLAVVLACAGAAAWSPGQRTPHHRVEMRNLMFQPPDRRVAPGDTISWVNHDIVPHTVTGVDGRWDSGEIPPGGSFTLVAEGADTIRYRCRYHPTMIGSLVAP